jgi:hypothetical protein
MSTHLRQSARVLFTALLLGACASLMAQEARVDAASLKIEPVAGEKKIEVSLRLADTPAITTVSATVKTGTAEQTVPAAWTSFASTPPANCAWLIVIDNSNPARQPTVAACVNEVRALLSALPKGDAVMIASLSRDLVVESPFESAQDQRDTALAAIKADGEASLTTLIYQNVKHGLTDHLARRSETRKCVVLLTDGKDETPGGPVAVKARRDELIMEAKKLGIPVHSFGFAEKATEANYFADLKEASLQTGGMHAPAVVATRQLEASTWPTLIGVMHGGGTATLDLSALKEAAPVQLEVMTASGKKATVMISKDTVASALPSPPAPKTEPVSPQPQVTASSPPAWIWWAAGAAVLVLGVFVAARSKRGAVEKEIIAEAPAKTPQPTRPEPAAPAIVSPTTPLAYLERCDDAKTRHPVTSKGVIIGLGKHNDLKFGHENGPESQCVISLTNHEWVVAEAGSGNAAVVNGKYYYQTTLSPNDVIEVGEIKLRFLPVPVDSKNS